MNRKSALLTALVAGLLPVAALAQVSPAPPASTPAPAASAPAPVAAPQQVPAPQPIPAKIALISFRECVMDTNEGQRTLEDVQKKYKPQADKLKDLSDQIESLKKQLQAAPPTMTDEARASLTKSIDTKTKQLTRDGEDATNAYNADLQEAYGKVANKVNILLQSYVKLNGYTLVLDVSNEQSAVLAADPQTDITEAMIAAYNASSGVAAPPPPAPAASKPKATPAAPAHPSTTTPARPPQ